MNRIRTDNRPLFVLAVDALRSLIEKETFRPGERLPPEDELARQLGISRTTLRMALGHLELQGLIVRRQGVGTYVSSMPPFGLRGGLQTLASVQSLARAVGLRTKTLAREVSVVSAPAEWLGKLNVESDTPMSQVKCTIAVEGKPVAFLRSLIPERVVSANDLNGNTGSLLEFLIERGEPRLTHTQSQVFAIEADRVLAEQLDVAVGKALLHLAEVYYSEDGKAVALSFNYFVSDRFGFYIGRQIAVG